MFRPIATATGRGAPLRVARSPQVAGETTGELSALASIDRELVLAGVPHLDLVDVAQLARAGAVRLDAPRLPPEVAGRLRALAAAP